MVLIMAVIVGTLSGQLFDVPAPSTPSETGFAITLFPNGDLSGGVSSVLTEEACNALNGSSLGVWAAQTLGGLPDNCEDCTVYDGTARRLYSCADIEILAQRGSGTSGARKATLWVVAPERWFVFPPGELGRVVALPRIQSPRGPELPILVETISLSPRVFHLHNFITEAEVNHSVGS